MILQAPTELSTVNDIDFLLHPAGNEDLVIDLRPVNSIKPVGAVGLPATLERLLRNNGAPRFRLALPEDQLVQGYLRETQVFQAMRHYARFPDVQPEDIIPGQEDLIPMVPCTRFTSSFQVEQLSNEMFSIFTTQRLGPPILIHTYTAFLGEIADNVILHADSTGGYVLVQQYINEDGPVVDVSIADCGIGVRSSLEKNPDCPPIDTDMNAIELALREGVSSLQDPHRGFGLYDLTDNLQRHAGRQMTVRSGNGIIIVRGNGEVVRQHNPVHYPGTIFNVTIPCPLE